MDLTGKNFITGELSSASNGIFRSVDPARQSELPPDFYEASVAEIDRALEGAAQAHETYRAQSPEKIACFLERIGEEIIGLGDALLRRAELETALPEARDRKSTRLNSSHGYISYA